MFQNTHLSLLCYCHGDSTNHTAREAIDSWHTKNVRPLRVVPAVARAVSNVLLLLIPLTTPKKRFITHFVFVQATFDGATKKTDFLHPIFFVRRRGRRGNVEPNKFWVAVPSFFKGQNHEVTSINHRLLLPKGTLQHRLCSRQGSRSMATCHN